LVLFGAAAIVILSLLGGVGSNSEIRHKHLIVDLLMLQHDWY
jgi:hypothetical protein